MLEQPQIYWKPKQFYQIYTTVPETVTTQSYKEKMLTKVKRI